MKTLVPLLSLWALAAFGQQPRLANARLETRSAAGGLDAALRQILAAQASPGWLGYAVPAVPGERHMCCSSSEDCCGGCRLEGGAGAVAAAGGPVQLEAPNEFFVFYRVEQHRVDKVRTFSPDCAVDAGGLPFYWLTGVQPGQSVAFLAGLVHDPDRLADGAIGAIALHADAAADRALDDFVNPARPENIRRKAAFWLGAARGRHGFETLSRLVREDPSERVREHAIFALTQSKEPGATQEIIRAAREDKSARVRGQALFWLAQKASRQIAQSAIAEAIEKDPETDVKRKAVFALTQIPGGDGVPLLIQVARTNRNPAVRKQAMFWLGQSKDPRAVRFFEEILAR